MVEVDGLDLDLGDKEVTPLPEYVEKIHGYFYLNKKSINILDNVFIVNLIRFFYADKLAKAVAEDITPEDKVLQLGATYGNQIYMIADNVGDDGHYDIVDVAEIQCQMLKDKFGTYPQVTVYNSDAEVPCPSDEKYDVVTAFFLLHEVPDSKKTRIIENMLNSLNEKSTSKIILVDYNRPLKWNPFGHVIRYVTRLLSPFTESLLEKEISSFTSKADDYLWNKETFFGGLYQKITVMKKIS